MDSPRLDSSLNLLKRAIEDIHSILLEVERESYCEYCNRSFFNAKAKEKLKRLTKLIEGE